MYDPNEISDSQMLQWGREAAAEALSSGRVNNRFWQGTAPNELKFEGYLDETGAIKNLYPTINP